jgi:hypothetical protein
MSRLSLRILAMVLRVIASESAENLVPLLISVFLIFGLWAIRAVQPGVPAVGAFVDYVAFLWAEIIVGVSAVIVACTWLLGSQKRSLPCDNPAGSVLWSISRCLLLVQTRSHHGLILPTFLCAFHEPS